MNRMRVLIAGAAGRDFHNFNLVYRGRREFEVVGFTATQIPNIDGRVYPAELAGELYPEVIPIWPEADLERTIARHAVDDVVFAYSDVTHEHVMHLASRALAAGASYRLLRAHRLGEEPDDPARRRAPARGRQARRRPPAPDALRRPRRAGRAAVRALRGPRRGGRDDRGARGVRAPPRRGQPRLRGDRLRR